MQSEGYGHSEEYRPGGDFTLAELLTHMVIESSDTTGNIHEEIVKAGTEVQFRIDAAREALRAGKGREEHQDKIAIMACLMIDAQNTALRKQRQFRSL
jgi:hypothetical protein